MEINISQLIEKCNKFNELLNSNTNTIEEIKNIIESDYGFLFKNSIEAGDLILLFKDEQPYLKGLLTVKSIKEDIKKGWWLLTMRMPIYPPPLIVEMSLLLKDEYMNGNQIFTLNNIKHIIKPLKTITEINENNICIQLPTEQPINNIELLDSNEPKTSNVVSIDFKKKKQR